MASGSMGAVYKAERVPVGKLVAIKFLHASFANDSEFQARFERETRVMSKLAHPNCVSVVDFGVWEDAPYLVMDFVAGTTLRALIDEGPMPPPRALALARADRRRPRARARAGLVHRDIKPANIMISEEIGTASACASSTSGSRACAATSAATRRRPTWSSARRTTWRPSRPCRAAHRRAHRHLRRRRRAVRDDRRRAAVPGRGHAAAARHAPRRADPAARRSRARRALELPEGCRI